jgi:hypothetical protein
VSGDAEGFGSGQGTFDVVWPSGPTAADGTTAATTRASFERAVIAFLWNGAFHGDVLYPELASRLSTRFPASRCVGYDVFGDTHGRDEERVVAALPSALQEHGVQFVISGIGN